MPIRLSLALSLALVAGGCTEPASPDGPAVTSGVQRLEAPVTTTYALDLLFVVDSSPGIAPHRAKLLDSYRRLVQLLESLPTGFLDLHLGVVTADVGTRGMFSATAGPAIGTGPGSCTSEGDRGELRRAASIDGRFLVDRFLRDGTRERSYTGSLADAFVQLADAGAEGCTYVRPLEAMRRAITDTANAGFVRDGARLAVVFITSDDDCSFAVSSFVGNDLDRSRCAAATGDSLVSIGTYVSSLVGLKRDSNLIVTLGAFAPPGAPACPDTRPAARLATFLSAFSDRPEPVSICGPNLDGLLEPATAFLRNLLGPPCFGSPVLDTDPATDGLQPECASWYRYGDPGELVEESIPACAGDAPGPCWKLRRDPSYCISGGEMVEYRHRPGFDGVARAQAIIECVTR